MTDIMQDWKNQKFVVAPQYLMDDFKESFVILTDIKFWSENIDELVAWCDENNCTNKGMTVVFSTPEQLTAFCLKWS
jgi:thymidine kinase